MRDSTLGRLSNTVEVVPLDDSWPRTDWLCLLMDLSSVLGVELDSMPNACPYLAPRGRPRSLLPARTKQFRVGIAWAGSPDNQSDHPRACRLDDFAPLFELPGTEFVSFQVGPCAKELRTPGWWGLIHDAGDEATFEAVADALLDVDLVIIVDTAMAHLAGAAGRPVWTLLPFAPDWRWMRDRADPPWYLTMRLCRQPAPVDRSSVFRKVRRALGVRVAEARGDHARPRDRSDPVHETPAPVKGRAR